MGQRCRQRRLSGEHRVGKGRVVWGSTPEKVLAGIGLPCDFSCEPSLSGKLRYTHRRTDDGAELYFVANKMDAVVQGTCDFRATAGQPEFWRPQTGRIEPIATYQKRGNVMQVALRAGALRVGVRRVSSRRRGLRSRNLRDTGKSKHLCSIAGADENRCQESPLWHSGRSRENPRRHGQASSDRRSRRAPFRGVAIRRRGRSGATEAQDARDRLFARRAPLARRWFWTVSRFHSTMSLIRSPRPKSNGRLTAR